jgi:enoyl-CoA hydratase
MPWNIERRHHHVAAVLTMNTNKVNAQNPAFFADLHTAFDRLDKEFSDCAVVLTGTGCRIHGGPRLRAVRAWHSFGRCRRRGSPRCRN